MSINEWIIDLGLLILNNTLLHVIRNRNYTLNNK